MIDKDTLHTDGVARIATSIYPAQLQIDSMGATGNRILIIEDPAGGWLLGAWKANPAGGEPIQIVLEHITDFNKYVPRMIDVTLKDGRRALITPDRGCACGGGNIRNYNPFGAAVNLARVPAPDTATV